MEELEEIKEVKRRERKRRMTEGENNHPKLFQSL